MDIIDDILILRVKKIRESDLWVRFLSAKMGVASAIAFGGCLSKHRFPGCLDGLNEVQVRLRHAKREQYLNLEEGILIHGAGNLRQDWRRLGMAANCLKFIEAFGIGEEGAGKAYNFIKNILFILEKEPNVSPYLPIFFRLRLTADQGYAPYLGACQQCGKNFEGNPFFFQIHSGGIRCSHCVDESFAIKLDRATVNCLQNIIAEKPQTWPLSFFSSQVKKQCVKIIEGFIQHHIGLIWDNGYFRKI